MSRIYVSPTGRRVEIKDEDADLYDRLGYRPEEAGEVLDRAKAKAEREYYSQPLQRLSAGVEGAVSVLSFGAYDALSGANSDVAKRAAYNPGTRLAGEIVGALTPLGATAALARAGKTTARALGGGRAARAAGGAVEGGGFGLQQAISSSSLSGDPLNAETFVAGVGLGGLIGGATHAVGGSLVSRANRLEQEAADEASRIGRRAEARAALEAEAFRLESRVAGVQPVLPRGPTDHYRWVVNNAADELAASMVAAQEAAKSVRGAFTRMSDELIPATGVPEGMPPAVGAVEVPTARAPAVKTPPAGTLADEVNQAAAAVSPWVAGSDKVYVVDVYEALFNTGKFTGTLDEFKRKLLRDHRAGTVHLAQVDMPAVANAEKLVQSTISRRTDPTETYQLIVLPSTPGAAAKAPIAEAGDRIGAGAGAPAKDWTVFRAAGKAADDSLAMTLAGKGETAAARAAVDEWYRLAGANGLTPSLPREAADQAIEAAAKAAENGALARRLREFPKNPLSMSNRQADLFAAVVEKAGAAHDTPALAALMPATRDWLGALGVRSTGPLAVDLSLALSTARRAVANAPTTADKAANRLALKRLRGEMKKIDAEIAKEAREAAAEARPERGWTNRLRFFLAAGTLRRAGQRAGIPDHLAGPLGYAAAGYTVAGSEGGVAGALLGARSRVKTTMDDAIRRWGKQADESIRSLSVPLTVILGNSLLTGEPDPDSPGTRAAAKRRSEELNTLIPRLSNTAYAATAPLIDGHPELQRAAEETVVRAVSYLHTMAPRNPRTVIVAGRDRWEPSEIQARDFGERMYAVGYPTLALNDFLGGSLSPAGIHALSAVYPSMYQEARRLASRELSDPGVLRRLGKHGRNRASFLIGVPLDGSQRPDVARFFLEQHASAPAASPPPPPASRNLGGRPGVPAASAGYTDAQILESR